VKKLAFSDIQPLAGYEQERVSFRQRIIALKAQRRIAVGDLITLVFENRETVRFQIQEMMRVERLDDEERIKQELETYNKLIPERGELSATLFIEIVDPDRVKEILDRLMGIDEPKHVWFQLGDEHSAGAFEAGHSSAEKLSAVHYVRFRLTPNQQRVLADPKLPVHLVIDHPNYRAAANLSVETRRALLGDLSQRAVRD